MARSRKENHYYPIGLIMAGASDKAIKTQYVQNKYRRLHSCGVSDRHAYIYILQKASACSSFFFTLGKVTEITKPGWKNYGDYSVLYEYKVNGKRYNANSNFKYCQGQSMGVDAFLLDDNYIQPSFEHSIDLTGGKHSSNHV